MDEPRKKRPGQSWDNYIEEQIRDAQERGEFDNLPGAGKPLQLEQNVYAGDKAMGYNLLKSNQFAPPEIELLKEVRTERERIEARLTPLPDPRAGWPATAAHSRERR